jgi:hypothetical protein
VLLLISLLQIGFVGKKATQRLMIKERMAFSKIESFSKLALAKQFSAKINSFHFENYLLRLPYEHYRKKSDTILY